MSERAFGGDAATKAALLEDIRVRWRSGALVPDTNLNWGREDLPDSVAGALGQTRDRGVFQDRTGIPVDLALFCEALVMAGTPLSQAEGRDTGLISGGEGPTAGFVLEWLDAVRPGADLRMVLPQFARRSIATLSAADFPLAPFVDPAFRTIAVWIADCWDRELAGEDVTTSEWRSIRKAALLADAARVHPWGYRIAVYLESLAWPIRSVSREFVGLFEPFLLNMLMHSETDVMTDEERQDRVHLLDGLRALAVAPRDEMGAIVGDPLEGMLDAQRVISPEHLARTADRMAAVRAASGARKTAIVRGVMNEVLDLIRHA